MKRWQTLSIRGFIELDEGVIEFLFTNKMLLKIEPGSHIVLYNYEENPINVDGYIRNQ